MTFPSENEDLQLKFYLFRDDLKVALYGDPDHPNIEQEKARKYVQDHFRLSVNGKSVALRFDSMQEKNDQLLLQFTSPGTRDLHPSTLEVTNTLLNTEFRNQVNMVYLIAPGKDRITMMLHASKTVGTFSL